MTEGDVCEHVGSADWRAGGSVISVMTCMHAYNFTGLCKNDFARLQSHIMKYSGICQRRNHLRCANLQRHKKCRSNIEKRHYSTLFALKMLPPPVVKEAEWMRGGQACDDVKAVPSMRVIEMEVAAPHAIQYSGTGLLVPQFFR